MKKGYTCALDGSSVELELLGETDEDRDGIIDTQHALYNCEKVQITNCNELKRYFYDPAILLENNLEYESIKYRVTPYTVDRSINGEWIEWDDNGGKRAVYNDGKEIERYDDWKLGKRLVFVTSLLIGWLWVFH